MLNCILPFARVKTKDLSFVPVAWKVPFATAAEPVIAPLKNACTPLFQNLEDKERKHSLYKEQLSREQRFLRRRLEQLNAHRHTTKRRSVSECSSSTVSSSHSTLSHSSAPSPISESGKYFTFITS